MRSWMVGQFLLMILSVGCLSLPAQASLQVAVEVSSSPAAPGELLFVRLTVANSGTSTASTVRLEVPYPSGLFSLSTGSISDGGSCSGSSCEATETLAWNLGDLPAGAGRSVYFSPTVSSSAANGSSISLLVRALESTIPRDQATQVVTINSARLLNVAARAQQDPVAPGSQLTYEVVYGNRGGAGTSGTVLRFPIPPGSSFVSATDGGSLSGNEVVWNLGLLNAGDSGQQRVTVQLGGSAVVGSLLEVDAVSVSGDFEGFLQSALVALATRVENAPQLDFAIVTSNGPSRSDEFLHTYLTVTNRTAAVLTNVRLEMFYNSGLVGVSESVSVSDGGTCGGFCEVGETVFWNLGSLPPGTGKTVTLTPSTLSSNPNGRLIPLVARAFADSVRDRWERRIVATRNNRPLDLSIYAQQDPVAPAGQLTYELVYGNRGGAGTSNTTLRFPIPVGGTFVSATDGGSVSGGEVVWNLGLLNAGDSGQRRVTVQLGGAAAVGTLLKVDAASISGEAEFLPQTTRVALATRVENAPQLDFAIVTSNGPSRSDEFLHTYLTVTNRTAAVLTNVRLEMFYNSGLVGVSESVSVSDGGTCGGFCEVGETVFWNLGSLPPGTGKTVTLTPSTLSSNPNGRLIPLVARAFADSVRDRWERKIVATRADRSLSLTVDAFEEPTLANPDVRLLLTIANRNATAALGTELRMPVPAGTSFISADGNPSLTGGEIVWAVGSLGQGQGTRREVLFQANMPVAGQLVEVDAAEVVSSNLGTTRATRVVPIKPNANLALAATVIPNALLPGNSFTVTPVVENRSGATMAGVGVEMFYPNLVNPLNNSVIIGGGCAGSTCDTGELVIWSVGEMPAGNIRNLAIAPTVTSGVAQGRITQFFIRARNDAGDRAFTTRSALIGTFVPAPPLLQTEIEIRGNNVIIANGHTMPSLQDHTDFGSTSIGSNFSRTFTVRNLGGLALTLTANPPVVLSGDGAAQFQITTHPTTPIAPANLSTFTLRYTPTVAGTHTAVVSIANNDADENPTTFTIQGIGSGTVPDLVFRNGFELLQ